MTIEEAQARIADLEKELAALKQPDPLVEVGKAYCDDLKQEILKQAKAIDEEAEADYAARFNEIPNPSLSTLKTWREGVQKRFDAKFPPQAKGQQRPDGEPPAKQIAERPVAGGRF